MNKVDIDFTFIKAMGINYPKPGIRHNPEYAHRMIENINRVLDEAKLNDSEVSQLKVVADEWHSVARPPFRFKVYAEHCRVHDSPIPGSEGWSKDGCSDMLARIQAAIERLPSGQSRALWILRKWRSNWREYVKREAMEFSAPERKGKPSDGKSSKRARDREIRSAMKRGK